MRFLLANLFVLFVCGSVFAQRPHPPLLVTLDHNDDFVITGIGQPVVAVNFTASGPLLEDAPGSEVFRDPETDELIGSAPAPFSLAIGGIRSDSVTYSAPPGQSVNITGSYPLLFGPLDIEKLDQINLQIGYDGDATPYENPFGEICTTCVYPDATITPDGGIVVTNINDPILRISVFANDGGLSEITEVPFGASVLTSTARRLVVENPNGFAPADLGSLEILAGVSASANAFVKFDLESGTSFGPMPMASAVPEPSGSALVFAGLLTCLAIRRRR